MSIAATVEAILLMATLIALLEVASQPGGAAHLDGSHDAPPGRGHRRVMIVSISR